MSSRPKPVDRGLSEGFAGVFLRGVGFLIEGATSERFDGADGLGGARCVDVGDGDVGAFFGEADGGGFAEAAGGAGNDGDLVLESVGDGHAFPFGGAARVCRLPSRRAHACKESSRSADSVTGWRRGWQLRTVRRWSGHGGDLSLAGGRSVESLVIGDFVGPEDRRRWTDGWRVGSAGRRNGTAAERLARMLQKGLDDARV